MSKWTTSPDCTVRAVGISRSQTWWYASRSKTCSAMRGIVARRRSTIHPVAFPLALIIVLVTVIALIGIRVYRREEGRAPYLRQLADGEITVDEVPPSLQKALASP